MWEQSFLFPKLPRVNTAAAAPQSDGMAQLQHLMKYQILERVLRNTRVVENAAHHDGVVGGIIVAEAAAGMVFAPAHQRARHQPMEEPAIEVVKDLFQVVVVAPGAG